MVTRLASFLSSAEIASLHDDMGRGFRTVEEIQDPPVVVTFDRRGTAVATNVRLIRIRLNGGIAENGQDQGAIERLTGGTLRAWATDVTDVKEGDRFSWGGHAQVVRLVEPSRFGTVTMQFERHA